MRLAFLRCAFLSRAAMPLFRASRLACCNGVQVGHMQQLLGWLKEEHAQRRQEALSLIPACGVRDVAKTWCDPTGHAEVVGGDVGGGCVFFHSLRAGVDHEKIPCQQVVAAIAAMEPGTLLVVERAHMATPQTAKSLAQPWTADQLQEIYKSCRLSGVTLRLFPHQHTTKARCWAAMQAPEFVDADKSSDMNDARAIAYYVEHNNGIALLKPPASFASQSARRYGSLVIKRASVVLNAARARGYAGEVFPHVAGCAAAVLQERQCGIAFVSNEPSAFSVASLVCGEIDGDPVRFVYRGKTPGVGLWMRNVVKSSSCHYGGGVARSNLFYHRLRAFIAEYGRSVGVHMKDGAKVIPFHTHTLEQESVKKNAMKEIRRQLRGAYQVAVLYSQKFRPYEVLDFEEAR